MKLFLTIFGILFFAIHSTDDVWAGKWGKTGHRVVGDIAEQYLTDKARSAVRRVLGHESLAMASTWMDEIRSDSRYDHTHDWHWVTIPDGMTYGGTQKNPKGDIIQAIITIITDLRKGGLDPAEEAEKLKMLVHLIGDIHQPLHVGTGEDRGGNDTRVEWFWEPSNMHRVWDSGMIDEHQLSYTELSGSINHPTKAQVREWQASGVMDWAYESMELRDQVYNLPEDRSINYEYMYRNFDTVEQRLLQAGVRLAGVLNEIYG
jgi:hypothetical protein